MMFSPQQEATLTDLQKQMIELGYMTNSLTLTIEGRKMVSEVLFTMNQEAIAKLVEVRFTALMENRRAIG